MSRRIVITGATRGLGRALVGRFVEAGHTVQGCGRSAEHIASLRAAYPPPHDFQSLDVADDEAVALWAGRIIEQAGPPDILINNAALINDNAPLWEVPREQFDAVIDVNIKGVVNVIRHFVPAMIERGEGVIINLSSGWGRSTSPQVAPYCATKWAMEGLTGALAQELPAGMAAVPLNPGAVDTDMLRPCFGSAASGYPDAVAWSRSAAKFMLSITAKHNGEPLTVR